MEWNSSDREQPPGEKDEGPASKVGVGAEGLLEEMSSQLTEAL